MIIVSGKKRVSNIYFNCKIHLYDRKEEAEKAERIQFQAERMETELRELKNLLKENVKNNSSR